MELFRLCPPCSFRLAPPLGMPTVKRQPHTFSGEGHALAFEPHPLLEAVGSRKRNSASGRQDAMPGQPQAWRGGPERPTDLARVTGRPDQFRDVPVGCNRAARDAADQPPYLGEAVSRLRRFVSRFLQVARRAREPGIPGRGRGRRRPPVSAARRSLCPGNPQNRGRSSSRPETGSG